MSPAEEVVDQRQMRFLRTRVKQPAYVVAPNLRLLLLVLSFPSF